MKESITICDRCNLNLNDNGPRAGEIAAVVVQIDGAVSEPHTVSSGDLCVTCGAALIDAVKDFFAGSRGKRCCP